MNTRKDRRRVRARFDIMWRRARPAAIILGAALCLGSGGPASAEQPARNNVTAEAAGAETAAPTVVRTGPYLKVAEGACASGFCEARIIKLRKNKLLHVRNVSCRIDTSSAALADYAAMVALVPETSGSAFEIFVPRIISGAAPNETWSFNHETTFYAYPREKVVIQSEFEGGSVDAMRCKVAGELQTVR